MSLRGPLAKLLSLTIENSLSAVAELWLDSPSESLLLLQLSLLDSLQLLERHFLVRCFLVAWSVRIVEPYSTPR